MENNLIFDKVLLNYLETFGENIFKKGNKKLSSYMYKIYLL